MVQGENCGNYIDTSCTGYGTDSKSKRGGFLAAQQKLAAEKKAASSKVNQNSSKTNNWGPFKDRNDFVNMHFC